MVHEWALAESIIYHVMSQGYRKVKTLKIRLGILQGIDKEILGFSLRELASMNNIEIKDIVFEDEEPLLECSTCGYKWSLSPSALSEEEREAIHFVPEAVYALVKCPKCGSRDFTIVKGRGVSSIEVVSE
ncbi:hydrogenase nickel incorporation protein HypA [Desulfurococcus amylolyticus]|uniref:hydrogenase nickel incorporation protein HypA n=1 Tax=Desulfurococcus TaxID=2273 RepID=UPI0023F566A9|nr:hydrogenase nickel incorporation protein HypA [Desulfurococcus amylolyticus]